MTFLRRSAPALLYLLAACAATWPLALHLGTHLPLGTEAPATVALFNLWTLRWNADRLAAGYAGYWHAPIFYPQPGAFALSEPQPATGLVFAALAFFTGNPVAAYNAIVLLALALNGWSAYFLFRTGGAARGPALLGGLLALALPFACYELGVLQLLMFFPIWLALAALLRFAARPGLRPALALGGALALAFLTCEYYGAFAIVVLGVAGAALLAGRLGRAAVGDLLLGGALATVLLLPVLPAQARYTSQFARSDATIAQNSARLADYLRLPPGAWGEHTMPWLRSAGGSGLALNPGTVLLALALLGAWAGWRAGRRRWVAACLAGALLAFLISFGLNLVIAGWAPYQALRVLPGWTQLRSPFRMAAMLQLLLAALAGGGLGWLWQWRGRLGRGLAVALTFAALAEVLILPAPLYRFPAGQLRQPWIGWLRDRPAGAVALLPFPASGAATDYERTAVGMLQAFEHGHPLVNGYSGFFPPDYVKLFAAMQHFPDQASLQLLREHGATYLVAEAGWAAQHEPGYTGLELLYADSDVQVYRLAP